MEYKNKSAIFFLIALFFYSDIINAQFPAICNTPESLNTKKCCPNNCGGLRGNCTNITSLSIQQWSVASSMVVNIMRNAPYIEGKQRVDSRYLWPTVVFENVCICLGNYYGVDCNECQFGYTGPDCTKKTEYIIRKPFDSLTETEKEETLQAFSLLKNETGKWSVVVDEPLNYTYGTVTLQNVSTYDMFTFLHAYVGRDSKCNTTGILINFSHAGPAFAVWHRHFVLAIEREMQLVLKNENFSLPYWNWETNNLALFADEYFGLPAIVYNEIVNVTGKYLNSSTWNTVCDFLYRFQYDNITCSEGWSLCNPNQDLKAKRPLQRGNNGSNLYIPNIVEIKLAIAAPSYEASDSMGLYGLNEPRASFRSRLEGFSQICSAIGCAGNEGTHLHNMLHLVVGGHMGVVPSAVNDPIFFLHHCNIDRIFESWIKRFVGDTDNSKLLPGFAPGTGSHPGHNKDDWLVPFFPLVKVKDYYFVSEQFGYSYAELINSTIEDLNIEDCESSNICPICTANLTCINCSLSEETMCTNGTEMTNTRSTVSPNVTTNSIVSSNLDVILGISIGLGLPLLITIVALIILSCIICVHFCFPKKANIF